MSKPSLTPLEFTRLVRGSAEDLVFLRSARDALLTHPLFSVPGSACDAAMVRLVATAVVGTVDKVLAAWAGEAFLEEYETATDNKKLKKSHTNADRIRILRECFESAGVTVDPDVLADYLAIKYLRNASVHLGWKDDERAYLAERGFPSHGHGLTADHWLRMIRAARALHDYVNDGARNRGNRVSLWNERHDPRMEGQIELGEASLADELDRHFIRPIHACKIWRANLGRILEQLPQMVPADGGGLVPRDRDWDREKVARLGEIAIESWRAHGRDHPIHAALLQSDVDDGNRLFAELAAVGFEPNLLFRVTVLDLVRWATEQRPLFERLGISDSAILRSAASPVDSTWTKRTYVWDLDPSRAESVALLRLAVPELDSDRTARLLRAIVTASRIDAGIPYGLASGLFARRLPVLDPDHAGAYARPGAEGVACELLRESWYRWVEPE
jgi:hypothetical protein